MHQILDRCSLDTFLLQNLEVSEKVVIFASRKRNNNVEPLNSQMPMGKACRCYSSSAPIVPLLSFFSLFL